MTGRAQPVLVGVLFAGALVALLLRWEPGFWVLSGLTIAWQLAAIENDHGR